MAKLFEENEWIIFFLFQQLMLSAAAVVVASVCPLPVYSAPPRTV